MKKMLMVFVCAVLAFAFYGCKEETTKEKLTSGAEKVKEKAGDAAVEAGDAADDAKDKLNDVVK